MIRRQDRWTVIDDRGRPVSNHASEALAFAAIHRLDRVWARRLNKPGMMGGGYGHITYGVLPPTSEDGTP